MNPARQSALWTKLEMFNTERRVAREPRHKRSEKRRRTERVNVRLLPSELEALGNAANAAGVTVADLIRTTALTHINTAQLADHEEE